MHGSTSKINPYPRCVLRPDFRPNLSTRQLNPNVYRNEPDTRRLYVKLVIFILRLFVTFDINVKLVKISLTKRLWEKDCVSTNFYVYSRWKWVLPNLSNRQVIPVTCRLTQQTKSKQIGDGRKFQDVHATWKKSSLLQWPKLAQRTNFKVVRCACDMKKVAIRAIFFPRNDPIFLFDRSIHDDSNI